MATRKRAHTALRLAYALMLAGVAAPLLMLGADLLAVGGSAYYLVAGVILLSVAILVARNDARAGSAQALLVAGTLAWALWEVGLDPLGLAPRLGLPILLALPLLFVARPHRHRLAGVLLIATAVIAGASIPRSEPAIARTAADGTIGATRLSGADWGSVGGDPGATRFSTLRQIDPANVDRLAPAWTYRTGAPAGPTPLTFEATPLALGGHLFLCTGRSDVVALDGETGRPLWRFSARADTTGVLIGTCRGVAHARTADAGACADRIFVGTIDARLIALDAANGRPCRDFGRDGMVDLRAGMGAVEPGYYSVSSAPQVIRGRVVVGGWVTDGQHVNEPPGVVRAFDTVTGKLAWAFDSDRPDRHGPPSPGATYTLGTPNSWAPMSADEALGLVYVPTGNATPDYFGGQRRASDDRVSSSVVAIDAATGAVRWSFQTTHHDLWDYDVTAQPTLFDMPTANGPVPALVQATKRGELFVLDRRTGRPLTAVTERPAPTSTVPGERAAPTQPFSTGMPSLAGPRLTESDMWGLTPIDQAWCRLAYRRARYDGPLTPPGLDRPSFVYPGYGGGVEWGGVSIDPIRHILIVNSNRVADTVQLLPRTEARRRGISAITTHSREGASGAVAQEGTPYAADLHPFLSPLGMPCQRPPWGMLSAIDLKTRRLLWNGPFGTGRDSGPLGIASHIPLTLGVPNTGGSIVTASGLTFIGASHDRYLRAVDTASGRELLKLRLPAGGQATPMTYWSAASGRQFVAIAAGGSPGLGTRLGDYVVAYALPPAATAPPRP